MSNHIGALESPMPGTWLWGGVYGHSWFVDLRNAVYDALKGL